ncbi:MAG: hypothetical protein RL338_1256 [Chloroflexota bacterium]|jgi:subtilisin family serine protease
MRTPSRIAISLAILASLASPSALAKPSDATPDPAAMDSAAMARPEGPVEPVALPPHAPDALLVAFRPGARAEERFDARRAAGAIAAVPISPTNRDVERWTLPPGTTPTAAMRRLAGNPAVRLSELDWVVTRAEVSNDPLYLDGSLWGMHGDEITAGSNPYGTGADEAWALGHTGSRRIHVGVIDEGIQWSHEDLSANTWVSPTEIAGNAKDDDRNGYVDDVRGWDFYNGDASVFDGDLTLGWDAHGTHVAGTIGAVGGNGIGVAGVNWQVTMIPAKFMGSSNGFVSGAIAATDYLVDLKTRHRIDLVAINNSWTSTSFSQILLDSIDRAGDQGILYVAAAGNLGTSNDIAPAYPASYECTKGGTRGWDCVVAVAATDRDGARPSWSHYGVRSVDLGAPGSLVQSTYPYPSPGAYTSMTGSSMAAPHVTGGVALCASINPAMTARQRKEAILATGTPTPSLDGMTATGVRLDIGRLVRACLPAAAAPTGAPADPTTGSATYTTLRLAWSDGVVGETVYEVQSAVATNGVCGTYRTAAILPADTTSATIRDLTAGTAYCLRVRGMNNFGTGAASPWSAATTGRTVPPPPPYRCGATPIRWIDPSGGTALSLSGNGFAAVPLPEGFGFTTYGTPWSVATVSANGFLRPGATDGSYSVNAAIPSLYEPNGLVAPAWDEWDPIGGAVSYRTVGSSPNRRFVVTWEDLLNGDPYTGPSRVTFQAILHEGSDAVRFQYLDMSTGSLVHDFGFMATAGIESVDGLWGTQISHNARSLTDGTAYRCSAAPSGPAPTVTTTSLSTGTAGVAYLASLAATGGAAPYAWSLASGSLPRGLSLSTDGTISGTSASTGTFSFSVRVWGDDASTSTRALSLTLQAPPSITTSSLATGTAGVAYGTVTLAAAGGQSPYTWALGGGSLPTSLALGAGGVLSGAPTQSGGFTPTFRVTDSLGRTATRSIPLTVNFGKLSPPNGGKLSSGTTSATLTWATHFVSGSPAAKYRYCVAGSASACTTWTEVTGTSAAVAVAGGQTWYWQAQAWSGSAWVPANAGNVWRFSVTR